MPRLTVPRERLAAILTTSGRTLWRLEAAGIIRPTSAPKRGQVSLYDLEQAVPAYLTHLVAERPQSAKDRRDEAQAEFVSIKSAQMRRELLPAAEVNRAAAAVVRAAAARLARLEDDLARTLPEAADEVGRAVREALEELAALENLT